MSNHAARPKPKRTYLGLSQSALAVLILMFGIGLPLLITHPWTKDDRLNWPSVNGQVLETRLVVVNQQPHQYRPSEIIYQVQAHVMFERDGVQYDTWLPTSKQDNDKAFLEFWLSQKKSKTCTVRWPPKNPSYVEAVLY
jgi:hypothetical protein